MQHRLRARNAARTRRVLGRAHGGALKAGQLLSTVSALLPPDPEQAWTDALTALQEAAEPVPFPTLLPSLDAGLGTGLAAAGRPRPRARRCGLARAGAPRTLARG